MATSSGKDTNYIAILRSISAGSNIGSWYETLLSPLRKAISSQLALSSPELLSLKTPIFKGRRYEQWKGDLAQCPHIYILINSTLKSNKHIW